MSVTMPRMALPKNQEDHGEDWNGELGESGREEETKRTEIILSK